MTKEQPWRSPDAVAEGISPEIEEKEKLAQERIRHEKELAAKRGNVVRLDKAQIEKAEVMFQRIKDMAPDEMEAFLKDQEEKRLNEIERRDQAA